MQSKKTSFSRRTCLLSCIALCIAVAVLAGAGGARTITATIGDEVRLSGAAAGSDTIYLFLTGPNLAPDGVRLDNIQSAVVTGNAGTFTRVQVMGDAWSYRWNTRTAGGVPDAGTYTVWAVLTPSGRRDLANAEYSTTTVVLAYGGVETVTTGSILVTSIPAGATVLLDGEEKGATPVRIPGLEPGTYSVTILLGNYTPVEELVEVQTGRTTNVTRSLKLPTPVPATTAPPAPAASPEPTASPAPVAGLGAGLAVAALLLRRR